VLYGAVGTAKTRHLLPSFRIIRQYTTPGFAAQGERTCVFAAMPPAFFHRIFKTTRGKI
jgi:hypothetical protein